MAFSLSLNNISKKYNQNWIFKSVDISISNSEKLVILGANGSGKSTLLQIISGYVSQTDGTIEYLWNNKPVEKDNIYNHFSIAAPSIELIEEFTLIENANFFIQLKPLVNNMNADDIAQLCYLENSKDKPINQFSSGMKQRVKLALAITAQTPLLLLDEPSSNLDKQGIDWYKKLVLDFAIDKTIVVCSNQINDEFFFCSKQLVIDDYK
jgi:ABC-type multidrug transport system ATPase subunit